MTDALVILLALAMGVGVIAWLVHYLRNRHRAEREAQQSQFRRFLLQELQKRGTKHLDFASMVQECDIPRSLADEVAQGIYASFINKFISDGQITDAERQKLLGLSQALCIDTAVATSIESRSKERLYAAKAGSFIAKGELQQSEAESLEQLRQRLGMSRAKALAVVETSAGDGYRRLFREIVSDGCVTEAELEQLQRYREALGMTEADAKAIVRGEANDLYRDLFRRAMSDGRITSAELQAMDRFRQALGLSEAEALAILQPEALNLFRQCFFSIAQDGEITQDEQQKLDWIRTHFNLPAQEVQPYLDQVQRLKKLAAYRQGELPSLKTKIILESGEICHWEGPCTFAWETAVSRKSATGELIVTSDRLIFSSPGKALRFAPTRIIDIEVFGNGLRVKTDGNKGTGEYYVDDPEGLEAVLFGLVRKHKYLLSQNFSSNQSRRVPESVRREVFYRDGGRCVRCAAMEYLEYDHIIPYSRGGANTVNNIQLLCRRCNQLKGDRI